MTCWTLETTSGALYINVVQGLSAEEACRLLPDPLDSLTTAWPMQQGHWDAFSSTCKLEAI